MLYLPQPQENQVLAFKIQATAEWFWLVNLMLPAAEIQTVLMILQDLYE